MVITGAAFVEVPRMPKRLLALLMLTMVLVLTPGQADPAPGGEYCKWVDENGVVHYAERCPDGTDTRRIETQDEISESRIESAAEVSRSLLQSDRDESMTRSSTVRYRSLPRDALGPLPPNTHTRFLHTTGAHYRLDRRTRTGALVLFLETTSEMPEGAWVVARFPDPADIRRFHDVEKSAGPGTTLLLESPPSNRLKCWNYDVKVSIYSDRRKTTLLGIHPQTIQSQINLELVRQSEDLVRGVTTGLCERSEIQDFAKMSTQELNDLCEEEREKRLAPQRERLIRECVERDGKSLEYCESFYADYGDATRVGPHQMRPALYMDLPACKAARERRE
jgi:hypothetical protein